MNKYVIDIIKATAEHRPVLQRLMQLYLFELSKFDSMEIGKDGLYPYEYFDLYWSEKDRFPFLFYIDSKLAGFALANSYSHVNAHIATKSIAEFFVMPAYRQKNIGKNVAFRIFDMFPGNWEVCEMESNKPAQEFWRKVIAEYTDGNYDEIFLDSDSWRGPMQTFKNSRSA